MGDTTAGIIIVALSLAIGIFVGATNFVFGWGAFFLSVALLTLIYSLLKMAAVGRR